MTRPRMWPPPTIVPQQRSLEVAAAQTRRRLAQPSGLRVLFENSTLFDDTKTCEFSGQRLIIGETAAEVEPCGESREDDCEFTCGDEHVLTASKMAALSRLLPAVRSWLGMALRIREPLTMPLRVDTSAPCGFSGRVNVPSRLAELGSPDTDGALRAARPCNYSPPDHN